MNQTPSIDPRLLWSQDPTIRPYVFRRTTGPATDPNLAAWFPNPPLIFDPLGTRDVPFAQMVLKLDAATNAHSGMTMPGWVFYDCGLLPGLVAGFALHRSRASTELLTLLDPPVDLEWLPISLFIMIPGQSPNSWVAHNLSSVNSVLPAAQRRYGLGFITKAHGLWTAAGRTLMGVTQWTSPALRLHAHFGAFEILSAYTPIHSHPATLTYRVELDPGVWPRFFDPGEVLTEPLSEAGFKVDPKSTESLKSFQRRLEEKDARYYLNADQMSNRAPHDALTVYKREPNEGY